MLLIYVNKFERTEQNLFYLIFRPFESFFRFAVDLHTVNQIYASYKNKHLAWIIDVEENLK